MKRIFLLFLLPLILTLCLTGCDSSEEEVNILFNELKKNDIINDLNLVDKFTESFHGIIPGSDNYYVYKDSYGKLIAIHYESDIYSDNNYDYIIEIYNDVTINNNIEIFNSEIFDNSSCSVSYYYENGTCSYDNKYDLSNLEKYTVRKEKVLFFTKYVFEKQLD